MKAKHIRTCALVLASIWTIHDSTGKEWFVDANAPSSGKGTATEPFATLEATRDAIRAERASNDSIESTTVWVRGDFILKDTLTFSSEDAGCDAGPVVWKAAPDQPATLSGPQLNTLVSIYDCQNFTLENLVFTGVKQQALEVAHGYQIDIRSCKVLSSDHTGIHVFGGLDCLVTDCLIQNCGQFGIRVEAGDRTTLEAADHQVRNCKLQSCGASPEAFAAAIYVAGVGVTVERCEIENCDAIGIRLDGNEHQISENRLDRTCLQGKDLGAIYLGHDWTERGNVIEKNIITRTAGEPRDDVMAIYLDDLASGTIVRGNVISSAGRGIVVGGGESNQIYGNLIEDCGVGLQFDNRAQTWLTEAAAHPDGFLNRGLAEIAPYWGLYRNRYPELGFTTNSIQFRAQGNSFKDNLIQRSGPIAADLQETVSKNFVEANKTGDKLFVFRTIENATVLSLHVAHEFPLHGGMKIHRLSSDIATATP